jgi:hypothetical protein
VLFLQLTNKREFRENRSSDKEVKYLCILPLTSLKMALRVAEICSQVLCM